MDAVSLDELVQYLQSKTSIVEPVIVSAVALLVYDYVLTVHQEIHLVWFTPWSYTKLLFFLVRYVPFVNIYFMLADHILLNTSVRMCNRFFITVGCLECLGILLAEAGLMLRTWAVWHQNRYIGVGLATLWIGTFIPACILMATYFRAFIISPKPYHSFRGCLVTYVNNDLKPVFVMLCCVEIVVLILMVISAYRSYKHDSMGKLVHVVHRDGILYYVYLLVLTIVSIVIASVLRVNPTPNPQSSLNTSYLPLSTIHEEQTMITIFQSTLYSILTSRMMINIREISYKEPTIKTAENTIEFAVRTQLTSEVGVFNGDSNGDSEAA